MEEGVTEYRVSKNQEAYTVEVQRSTAGGLSHSSSHTASFGDKKSKQKGQKKMQHGPPLQKVLDRLPNKITQHQVLPKHMQAMLDVAAEVGAQWQCNPDVAGNVDGAQTIEGKLWSGGDKIGLRRLSQVSGQMPNSDQRIG